MMNRDQLIASGQALLDLDARGALVPHGIGGHARSIIEGFIALERTPAPDQTNAEVSDERLTFDHQQQADNYLEALLGYSGGFYGAAIKAGLPAAETVGPIAHIERAARELHRLALTRRSATSQASEGEWTPPPEFAAWFRSYLGEGIHVAFRKASDSRAADQIWKLIRDMPAGEWPAIVDFVASAMIDGMTPRIVAPVSKRVERLETALLKWQAYDQLLRTIDGTMLLGGDMPSVDALYDECVALTDQALQGGRS